MRGLHHRRGYAVVLPLTEPTAAPLASAPGASRRWPTALAASSRHAAIPVTPRAEPESMSPGLGCCGARSAGGGAAGSASAQLGTRSCLTTKQMLGILSAASLEGPSSGPRGHEETVMTDNRTDPHRQCRYRGRPRTDHGDQAGGHRSPQEHHLRLGSAQRVHASQL